MVDALTSQSTTREGAWSEGKAYLVIDRIAFGDSEGAVLCYCNPPVHQVGNPGLDAYLEGLALVSEKSKDL
ncbi:hypothetical protein, partial [Guyparkeria sp.]|uniref:hypothetical protein n=1 Tax=Guyparkeria sp. TaxID=2035736 RepID=UPI0039709DCE